MRFKQVLVTLLENAINVLKNEKLIVVRAGYDANRLSLELSYDHIARSVNSFGYLDKKIYSQIIKKNKEELIMPWNSKTISFSMEVLGRQTASWFFQKGMQHAAYYRMQRE